MSNEDELGGDDDRLPLPELVVLYRDQSGEEVVPVIDAMFRDEDAAKRHLNHYRPLREHEFLTLERVDHAQGVASVETALTASTMRMVITDDGPRAVPKEMAAFFRCEDPDCDCHSSEEGDDE